MLINSLVTGDFSTPPNCNYLLFKTQNASNLEEKTTNPTLLYYIRPFSVFFVNVSSLDFTVSLQAHDPDMS